jgi:hypothetical protein
MQKALAVRGNDHLIVTRGKKKYRSTLMQDQI